jgi:transposase
MDSRDQVIKDLRELIAKQSAQLEAQAVQLKEQAARIRELELQLAKARKDSTTSSKPPSSDIAKPKPKPKRRPGRPKNRRKGAQPGHEQHLRELLPADRVDETIEYEIQDEEVRRLGLKPTGEFETIQLIELPDAPVHVTEHLLVEYRDSEGNLYIPHCPELEGPIFGPRLLATIGWLKSVGHLSYSSIETWMEDVLQVPVSRGYLAKLCTGTISQSLEHAYDEAVEAIPHQNQLGSDETSIKENGKKHWIWCITATTFSVFHIAATRSREVLEKLVGTEFAGYLNLDYFSANCSFAWNDWIKAQYCWAHLIRDIRFLEKHPDRKTKAWAEQLLDRSRRLFKAYHRRDEMSAEGYRHSMLLHRDRFLELVRQPPSSKEAHNLAARFAVVEYTTDESMEPEPYDLSQDYFRFLFAEDVEPTNNHSEQQIRHCVIDRKITQGTRGEAGRRYHERMWTAIATCKKQNRSFFSFLLESITAKLNRQSAPTLLGA